jgi:hypothetical protein
MTAGPSAALCSRLANFIAQYVSQRSGVRVAAREAAGTTPAVLETGAGQGNEVLVFQWTPSGIDPTAEYGPYTGDNLNGVYVG